MSEDHIRLAVVISDTHCGSSTGLLGPDYHDLDDGFHPQNRYQRSIWKYWEDFSQFKLPGILRGDSFDIIVNGDMIEGNHHGGRETVVRDDLEHVRIALDAFRPLLSIPGFNKLYVARGTECHTNNAEGYMGHGLGAEQHPFSKRYAPDFWYLEYWGCLCKFQHHIGTTSRYWLRSGRLARHLANEQLGAVRAGADAPKVLGCAHCHCQDSWQGDGCAMCFTTPSWQGKTRYANKVVAEAREVFGATVMDWREAHWGELPRLHEITYVPHEWNPYVVARLKGEDE